MWILWSIPARILFQSLIFTSSMTRQSLTSCKSKKAISFQLLSDQSVSQAENLICLFLLGQMSRAQYKQSQRLLRLHFVQRRPALPRFNLTRTDPAYSLWHPETNLRKMYFSRCHRQTSLLDQEPVLE